MKRFRVLVGGLALLAAVCLVPSNLKACQGWGHGQLNYLGSPFGFGFSGNLYGLNYIPVPPYFSLHPPVYYGEQVYRSYGTSPYAAYPRRLPVEVQRVKPELIENPHVAPPAIESSIKPDDEVASYPEPLEIINPFVVGIADK